MIFFTIINNLAVSQDSLPYRPEDNYEVRLEYDFKTRPFPERDKIDYYHGNGFPEASVLPYLVVRIHIKGLLPEDHKVRITNNQGNISSSLKTSTEKPIVIDMGFTEDMKEKITPNKYLLTFLGKKRKRLNKITLEVQSDGTFLINDIENGKL